jgi:hypothetical protein
MRAAGGNRPGTGTREVRRRPGKAVARRRSAGQVLEEYILVLGFVALPLLVALPSVVGAIRAWMGRLTGWWEMPVP